MEQIYVVCVEQMFLEISTAYQCTHLIGKCILKNGIAHSTKDQIILQNCIH